MSRPPKPVAVIKAEGKAHRTKAELAQREQAETALLTGQKCFERDAVKADDVAHKEYKRLIKLMRVIGKDDALYAAEYNRYCELYSEEMFYKAEIASAYDEVKALRDMSKNIVTMVNELSDSLGDTGGDAMAEAIANVLEQVLAQNNELLNQRGKLLKQICDMDIKVKQKRDAMFAIEKENCMTVSAALRTIPKEVENKDDDALKKVLMGE